MCFTDTNRVHFPENRLRSIDPWVDDTPASAPIFGAMRTIFGHVNLSGSYYFYATHSHLYVLKNDTLFNITPLSAVANSLVTSPFTFTNASTVVRVAQTAHGYATGDRIKVAGVAAAARGVPANQLNGEHTVTLIDADTYSFVASTAATSSGTGGGAGVTVYGQIPPGYRDVATRRGFGQGPFGAGRYGMGAISTGNAGNRLPRIWSIDKFGNDVVFCPGDYDTGEGQRIYIWDGDVNAAPVVLSNAPTNCNFVCVVNNSILALCGNEIHHSEIGNGTVWTPGIGTNAFFTSITRVRRFVCAIRVGEVALVFTEDEVLLGRFVGEPDYWVYDDLSGSDGIVGPNAVTVLGAAAFWMGQRGLLYRFAGASAERVPNAQNEDWVYANLNATQRWKCFLTPDITHNQIWVHFPTAGNAECSDYAIFNQQAGHWTLGKLFRTASQRSGFVDNRYYMGFGDGGAQPADIYRHFMRVNSALALGWYAETAFWGRATVVAGFASTKCGPIAPRRANC